MFLEELLIKCFFKKYYKSPSSIVSNRSVLLEMFYFTMFLWKKDFYKNLKEWF